MTLKNLGLWVEHVAHRCLPGEGHQACSDKGFFCAATRLHSVYKLLETGLGRSAWMFA